MPSVDTFRSLFVHRDDVFAEQQPNGAYFPVRRPLTDDDIAEHLAGLWSIGTYVIQLEAWIRDGFKKTVPLFNTVSYIVFDLDTYDEGALKFLCEQVEWLVNGDRFEDEQDYRSCLLLENSGGKGYHIWLFLSEPIPAAQARAFAEPVRTAYDAENWTRTHHDFGYTESWPALEIFPKQDVVEEGPCRNCGGRKFFAGTGARCEVCDGTGVTPGFGNLVKLPLGVHAKSGKRSEIVGVQGWAKSVDDVQRLDVSLIPTAAPVAPAKDTAPSGACTSGAAPFACISKLLEEGAPQGCRDDAMYHFARFAKTQGLPQDLAEDWCLRVNEEFSPPLTQREVRTKVLSAYRATSEKHSCKAEWLKGFCGGPECTAPWNVERDGKVNTKETVSYLEMTPEQRREARLRGRV